MAEGVNKPMHLRVFIGMFLRSDLDSLNTFVFEGKKGARVLTYRTPIMFMYATIFFNMW